MYLTGGGLLGSLYTTALYEYAQGSKKKKCAKDAKCRAAMIQAKQEMARVI